MVFFNSGESGINRSSFLPYAWRGTLKLMTEFLRCLELILEELTIHITTVCTFTLFEPDRLEADVRRFFFNIQTRLQRGIPSSEESLLLRRVNKTVRILYLMIVERNSLQNRVLMHYELQATSHEM